MPGILEAGIFPFPIKAGLPEVGAERIVPLEMIAGFWNVGMAV